MSVLKDFSQTESRPTNFDWLAALLGSKSASDFKEFAGGGLKQDRKAIAADCLAYIQRNSMLKPNTNSVMMSVVMLYCGQSIESRDYAKMTAWAKAHLKIRAPRLCKHAHPIRKIALYNALNPRAGKSSTQWIDDLSLEVTKQCLCSYWYPAIDHLDGEFQDLLAQAGVLIGDYRNKTTAKVC